jgi:release factor glutamine methyltransferase
MTAPGSTRSPGSSRSDAGSTGARAHWTVLEVLRWMTARFEDRKMASPRLDAELLVAHGLGLSRVEVYLKFDQVLDAGELAALRDLVKRRQAGEPVAYLTGKKEFWKLALAVDRRVLVPRPETETLLDEAFARLPAGRPARVADVGTGSGALALAFAAARPDAALFASDVSEDALAVARANAERLGQAVTFAQGHLAEPLRAYAPFDLVLANLPYIPTADIAARSPEVRCEPRLALDGGPDGLVLVRALAAEAPALLVPGGSLLLEIGAGQAAEVVACCRAAGLVDPTAHRDLAGVERVVAARRNEA